MQVHGVIEVINDTQKVSDSFRKREIVITLEAASKYPQSVSMEVTGDKCELLDKYQVGQEVSVDFNLRGRRWDGPQGVKYFNTIQIWKIEPVNGQASKPAPATEGQGIVDNSADNSAGDKEDFPF